MLPPLYNVDKHSGHPLLYGVSVSLIHVKYVAKESHFFLPMTEKIRLEADIDLAADFLRGGVQVGASDPHHRERVREPIALVGPRPSLLLEEKNDVGRAPPPLGNFDNYRGQLLLNGVSIQLSGAEKVAKESHAASP